MPEVFEQVTQVAEGQPAVLTPEPEVKAEQQQDGGTDGAAPASELPAVEKPAGEQAAPESGEKPAAEEAAPEGEKTADKGKGGIDKRFAELTAARKEAERKAAETQSRLDTALDALSRLGKPEPKPDAAKPAEDLRPEQPEFSDPETFARDMATYTENLSMWAARQAVKADRAENEKRTIQQTQQQNSARVMQEFASRRKTAVETLPDYVEIAEKDDHQVTELMASAITNDPEGPAIAYYLGQHHDESSRIAALPPGQQLMEMGFVKATLLASRNKPAAKLPPPIKPQGNQGGVAKTLDDLDMDSYATKRNAELAAGRAH